MNGDKPLEAVSNAIELKPGHKYLLVFKGNMTVHQIAPIIEQLRLMDIHSLGIALAENDDLQVIEVPAKEDL